MPRQPIRDHLAVHVLAINLDAAQRAPPLVAAIVANPVTALPITNAASRSPRCGSTRPRIGRKSAHWSYPATVNLFRRCLKVIDTFRDFCQSEAARFDVESVNEKPFSACSYDPMDGAGIEPATHGFSVRCSTN